MLLFKWHVQARQALLSAYVHNDDIDSQGGDSREVIETWEVLLQAAVMEALDIISGLCQHQGASVEEMMAYQHVESFVMKQSTTKLKIYYDWFILS